MLRSLAAIIFSVILGLAAAKMIEFVGMRIFPMPEDANMTDRETILYFWNVMPVGYKLFLVFGWIFGAFIAAMTALLIGKRWAPLGLLAAVTIGLQGTVTLFYYPAELWLWTLCISGVAAAAFLAVKLTNAVRVYPTKKTVELFND
jgi:pimeloyl-ACP methyl ester carboxylesterase